MKKTICIIIILQVIALKAALGQATQQDAGLKKWKLVWSDEFNYTGLPDSNKWDYEIGFLRDVEKQYYTKKQLKNASVKNGYLYITARKENYPNEKYKFKNQRAKSYPSQFIGKSPDSIPLYIRAQYDSIARYTSASITTKGKAEWTYGKFEVRAKLPSGLGVWPVIWMLGSNFSTLHWPGCGEIDILEFIGRDPIHVYGTVHYADSITSAHTQFGKRAFIENSQDGFHIYTAEWTEKTITLLFDNKKYVSFDVKNAGPAAKNPFNKPFYFLINFALGGRFGGRLDDAILPQSLIVDYVRVYQ